MRNLMFILAVVTLMAACQKEDPTPNFATKNYLPLELGNYWVYQHYSIDSSGNEKQLSVTDSVFVAKDTFINAEKFKILKIAYNQSTNFKTYKILRDSLGHIVNEKGEVQFAENNFIDKLNSFTEFFKEDTLYTISNRMENPEYKIAVPAGTFEVLNRVESLNIYQYSGAKKEVIKTHQNNYYAPNTGLILDSYRYISTPYEYVERRLIKYHVFINNNAITN